MMPFLLLLVGLLLIFLEFYLPGAILGVMGGVLLFASILLFAWQSVSVFMTIVYIVGVAIALLLLIRFALWRIRTARPNHSIYSDASQQGYVASRYDHSLIGKKGVVATDLKPGGHILIEGKRVQAFSQAGYLVKGVEVIVVGGQEESLIVKPYK